MDTLKSQVQQVLFKDALLLVAIQYTASVTGHTEVVTEQQSQCAFPHTALLIGKTINIFISVLVTTKSLSDKDKQISTTEQILLVFSFDTPEFRWEFSLICIHYSSG